MKKLLVLAFVTGSISVSNLAGAAVSTLTNQGDLAFLAAVEHDGSGEQMLNSGGFETQSVADESEFDNDVLPVNRWSNNSRHHRRNGHRSNNLGFNIRFGSGSARFQGNRFRFKYGYSRKHNNSYGYNNYGYNNGYSSKHRKFSQYRKGYSQFYGGHSRFKSRGFKSRSIRRHRNHW